MTSYGGTTAAVLRAESSTLDVAITNAFILMKNLTSKGSKMTSKDFRLELASELIGDYCSCHRRARTSSSIRTLPLRHFPVKVNDNSCPAKRKRGNCAVPKDEAE